MVMVEIIEKQIETIEKKPEVKKKKRKKCQSKYTCNSKNTLIQN